MANRPIYHKVCIVCGKEFTAKRIHAKYCSNRCRAIKSNLKSKKKKGTHKRVSVFEEIDQMIDRSDIAKGSKVFVFESILKHILRTDNVPDTFSTGKYTFRKKDAGTIGSRYVTVK